MKSVIINRKITDFILKESGKFFRPVITNPRSVNTLVPGLEIFPEFFFSIIIFVFLRCFLTCHVI